MPGETGETPSEVVAQQAQPKRESVFTRFKNRLMGRSPQPQATETQQQPPATEPIQPAGVTPREAVRKLETGQATEMFRPFGQEIIPPSQQPPPETTAGWVKHEYERTQASIQKTPDQLAEEARIDAANLAKAQQPTEPLSEVSPSTQQETTLPEKVLEQQPEVPGEPQEVEEFLPTKPQPTTGAIPQTPTETAIPVQESVPAEKQPIPIQIPQEEKVPT